VTTASAVGGSGATANATAETGAALEELARDRYRARDYAGALEGYERAYAAYLAQPDLSGAARAARTVGWFHGALYGEWAVYAGWVRRAQTLLEQADDDGNGRGWILLAHAQNGSDLHEQKNLYLDAIAHARRCRDADLECDALASLGIMLVFSGYVGEGMGYLDEALAAVCSGEVQELSVAEGVFWESLVSS